MTRINAGIPVEILSDQHLLAEHREIKRIPRTKFVNVAPANFTLGSGHVLFFSNKPNYTFNRYCELYEECIDRCFSVEWYGDNWSKVLDTIEYVPTKADIKLMTDRIIERTLSSNQIPRFYGQEISKEDYITKFKQTIRKLN